MQEKQREKLVLLDAHAIIHRAYHALPDFATSNGRPTGALYGLVLMILKIAADLKPDYIVACYDLPKPTYRHEVYGGYKAGRAKTDDALSVQLEESKEICEALSIPIYSKEGFEADDMLGTIVEQMREGKVDIIIASGDMDTMQLVDETQVKVYTLKKGIKDTILYDESAVKERFGFAPKLLPDFKGLRGDPSDNIIGIEGIGEKSATDLVVNFGSIENIYKILKKNSEDLEKKGIKKRIIELLKNGEEEAKFSKMLATIRRDAPIKFELPNKKWRDNVDLIKANALFGKLEFRNMGEKLKNVLGYKKEEIGQESFQDNDLTGPENNTQLEETKVALWVTDSNLTDPKMEDIFNFAGTDNFEEARKYILTKLENTGGKKVFEDIEKPLIPIIKNMEERGVLIDSEFLKSLNKEFSKEISGLQKKIWKEAGEEFNVSSPKQLGDILFDKLGLSFKNQKKTSTGARSTKESELQKMMDLHPVVPLILEYRELSKLVSTYIEPIPKMLDANNRLHARFVQAGTTTGRISSKNPNLQNIPIGSERGRRIREAFIAPKGFKLVAFDYSQIELRVAAFLSGDKEMIRIFKAGEDIHSSVAAAVFGVPIEKVDREMRRQAKVINFGIIYGMGVNALAQNLKSDRKMAQDFLNKYFENFSDLAKYLDRTKIEAARLGYTETFFGRRRYFEGLHSRIPYIKAAAERMAINAPIQGTEADIIKLAMKNIDNFIKQNNLDDKIYLTMQIHDELVYEIEESKVDEFAPKIREVMQDIISPESIKGIPILVEFAVGKTLGETK